MVVSENRFYVSGIFLNVGSHNEDVIGVGIGMSGEVIDEIIPKRFDFSSRIRRAMN